jgi:hypothetical protein
VSAGGYVVAPIPSEDPLLENYIERLWEGLPPVQRDLPEWALTRDVWLRILQNEREQELKLARYFGPYHGRHNVTSHRAYWRTHDIDTMLREHSYHPEHHTSTG